MIEILDRLLTLSENSIGAGGYSSTPNSNQRLDLELHALYFETASFIIKVCNSPKSQIFDKRIIDLLIQNQALIKDESDIRWPYLFDSWISILDKIKKVSSGNSASILRLLESGMKTIIDIQDTNPSHPKNDQLVDYTTMVKALQLL